MTCSSFLGLLSLTKAACTPDYIHCCYSSCSDLFLPHCCWPFVALLLQTFYLKRSRKRERSAWLYLCATLVFGWNFKFDCIILFTFHGGVSLVCSVRLRFWLGILLNQAWREIDWKENTIMGKQFIPFSLTEGRVLSILWNKYCLPVCFKKWKLLISLWWLSSLFEMGFFFYSVQSFDVKKT